MTPLAFMSNGIFAEPLISRAFAEPMILDFVPSLHCYLRVRMVVFRTVCAKWMLARQATLRIMPVPIIPEVTFNGFIYLALFALLLLGSATGAGAQVPHRSTSGNTKWSFHWAHTC